MHLRQDLAFILALTAGPLAWIVIAQLGISAPHQIGPLDFLAVALLYPIVEELVFRGLIQGELRKFGWARQGIGPLTHANLITSVSFALLHILNQPLTLALLVFFPSLVFGYFRDRDGKLTRAVLLHIYYNTGYFGLMLW